MPVNIIINFSVVVVQICPTVCQSESDVTEFMVDLFDRKNYAKNVRPLYDSSTTMNIEIDLVYSVYSRLTNKNKS